MSSVWCFLRPGSRARWPSCAHSGMLRVSRRCRRSEDALDCNAADVVLAHNHPSGSVETRRVEPRRDEPRRDVPCRAVPCRAVPCHAMPCHAMPCHADEFLTQPPKTMLALVEVSVLDHIVANA
ncbi:MAG: hypothetical protein H7346_14340, partial [Burkholderiaceae bacterium]|nr:hypothetical protein [Burkholderiaceae bacterium]